MKIALLQTQQDPKIGGAYTFENQLLQALFKFVESSKHQFILYRQFTSQETFGENQKNLKIIHPKSNVIDNLKSKTYRHSKAFIDKIINLKSQYTIESQYERFVKESLLKEGIDIIWSLTPNCPNLDIPYIITVWDLQHRLQPYFPEVSIKGVWESRENSLDIMFKRATFIITGTERGKAEVENFYQIASERIKILPFPTPQFTIDISLDKDSNILQKYNIPNHYLFYPAQFWPHKNHVNLILTIKYLQEHYHLNIPLVLVGSDKGNQAYIKNIVEQLNLSQQVHFLGFVPQEDLIALYRHAFALIFVSFFGPDNLPPLEAFALGCPVIAAKVPGANEQLGNTAILVDPKDEKEIALAIKSLSDDSNLRQQLIQQGLIRASQWTVKDYFQGMLAILDEFEAIRRCWESQS